MPRKATTPRLRSDRLTMMQRFDLFYGNPAPSHTFATEADRRDAWRRHKDELMADWWRTDRLPWAHYKYDLRRKPPKRRDPRLSTDVLPPR